MKDLLEVINDLEAPPLNAAAFVSKKPQPMQLSLVVNLPKDDDTAQDTPSRSSKRIKSLDFEGLRKLEADAQEDDTEEGENRKTQSRMSCTARIAQTSTNIEQTTTSHLDIKPQLTIHKNLLGLKEVESDDEYTKDRLTRYFEEKTLRKHKDQIKSNWRRTSHMAQCMSKIRTQSRGSR